MAHHLVRIHARAGRYGSLLGGYTREHRHNKWLHATAPLGATAGESGENRYATLVITLKARTLEAASAKFKTLVDALPHV